MVYIQIHSRTDIRTNINKILFSLLKKLKYFYAVIIVLHSAKSTRRKMASQLEESKVLEYFTVYAKLEVYKEFVPNLGQNRVLNFDKNMEEFEGMVNDYLEEGWRPLGAPSFSKEWMIGSSGGMVIQALVREKNIERAVVVDVSPNVAIAENVMPLRHSARLASGNR